MKPDGHFWSWTIYDHPTDYPDGFVARRFDWDQPTETALYALDVDKLRRELQRLGLYRVVRQPGDDPVIMEVWL